MIELPRDAISQRITNTTKQHTTPRHTIPNYITLNARFYLADKTQSQFGRNRSVQKVTEHPGNHENIHTKGKLIEGHLQQ